MALIVADTSALVSLDTVASHPASPLAILLESHDLVVPEQVIDELTDTAGFDDPSDGAARAILDRRSALDVRPAELDGAFPPRCRRERGRDPRKRPRRNPTPL